MGDHRAAAHDADRGGHLAARARRRSRRPAHARRTASLRRRCRGSQCLPVPAQPEPRLLVDLLERRASDSDRSAGIYDRGDVLVHLRARQRQHVVHRQPADSVADRQRHRVAADGVHRLFGQLRRAGQPGYPHDRRELSQGEPVRLPLVLGLRGARSEPQRLQRVRGLSAQRALVGLQHQLGLGRHGQRPHVHGGPIPDHRKRLADVRTQRKRQDRERRAGHERRGHLRGQPGLLDRQRQLRRRADQGHSCPECAHDLAAGEQLEPADGRDQLREGLHRHDDDHAQRHDGHDHELPVDVHDLHRGRSDQVPHHLRAERLELHSIRVHARTTSRTTRPAASATSTSRATTRRR